METLFITAIEAIYAAATDPAAWATALQAIADCFADVGAILVYSKDDGSFGAIESVSLVPLMAEYRLAWGHRDIRAIRAQERGLFIAKDAITDADVLSAAEMDTDPVYTELLPRFGLKYFAGVSVSPDPHIAAAISVQRRADKPPYSASELELLTRLGRHAERALRLSVELLDAQLSNDGMREALSRLGIGVFALDSLGRVVFSNPAAERVEGDGLAVLGERLQLGSAGASAALASSLQLSLGQAHQVPDPKPLLIPRNFPKRPLTVYLLPVSGCATPAQEFLTQVRVIVLVMDPEPGAPPDPAVVRDVLGLTLGEAKVAALIGSGLPPREAAAKLGLTEETVRTALKRVFSKVGVSRQSELTALLTRLVLR